MVVFVICMIGLLLIGCTPSPLPDVRTLLIEQVQAEIAPALTFTTTGICPFSATEGVAFQNAQRQALRNLLSSPEAQALSLAELEEIFETAAPQTLGVDLIDERQEQVLVNLYPLFCQQSSRSHPNPELYVFSRSGEIWSLNESSGNEIEQVHWFGDRWAGWVHWAGSNLYTFIHVLPVDGVWSRLEFAALPSLQALSIYPPEIVYREGWREFTVSSDRFVSKFPPCNFGDNLSQLESRLLMLAPSLEVLNVVYTGELTYLWTGTGYQLTHETPYIITVILDDYTTLFQERPSEQVVAQRPELRVEAWPEYCDKPLPSPPPTLLYGQPL